MSSGFKHIKSQQSEVIKAVQKDSIYTNNLSKYVFDVLQIGGSRNWIRYNQLCKFLAQSTYHIYAVINRVQTLGEEYTGIIQLDSKYISLPSKPIQIASILIEFCSETFYVDVISKFEENLKSNHKLQLDDKLRIIKLIALLKFLIPYIKGFHTAWFYLNADKYHLSKRFTGINYVLIRSWLLSNQQLYTYRILGYVTFLQLTISLCSHLFNFDRDTLIVNPVTTKLQEINKTIHHGKCNFCFEASQNTSLTLCGHLFCWDCITTWLEEHNMCPVCRDILEKSDVTRLINY